MRLERRVITFTTATVLAMSALAGVMLLGSERRQLIGEMESQTRLLARSLQVSIENALRDGQTPDIVELLTRMELLEDDLDVLVFDNTASEPIQRSPESIVDPGREFALLVESRRDDVPVARLFERGFTLDRLVLAEPLRTDEGERIGS